MRTKHAATDAVAPELAKFRTGACSGAAPEIPSGYINVRRFAFWTDFIFRRGTIDTEQVFRAAHALTTLAIGRATGQLQLTFHPTFSEFALIYSGPNPMHNHSRVAH